MNFADWSDEDLEAYASGNMQAMSDEALEQLAAPPQDYVDFGGEGGDVPFITQQRPQYEEAPERSSGEKVRGVADAALTAATAATGGFVGQIEGGLTEAYNQAMQGTFGSPEAADEIERAAQERAATYTWQPRTEAGQEYLQDLDPVLGWIPPVIGGVNPGALRGAGQVPGRVRDVARADIPEPMPAPAPRPTLPEPSPGAVLVDNIGDSVGARRTPTETYRQIMAEQLPVPLTGESAPTAGQRTRNFEQLQFEQEQAKAGLLGAPLRERYQNQTSVLRQNLEKLMEDFDPSAVEPTDIGQGVDTALRRRKKNLGDRVDRAYQRAREKGEMEEPVTVDALPGVFEANVNLEAMTPNLPAVRAEAVRLGILGEGPDGTLQVIPQPIDTVESLRQFVNAATDFSDPRESRAAVAIMNAIDEGMEDKGGPAYQIARGLARRKFSEFKDTKIVADILGTKGKTTERRIPLEKMADQIIVRAPAEEMVKARNIMRKAGAEGDQAWRDLKAYGIQHIMDRAYSKQVDATGQPIIVPSQLIKAVDAFDKSGKLEILYGKQGAQVLRDVAELSRLLLTAPPGAVNYSNTASALRNILMDFGQSGGSTSTMVTRRLVKEMVGSVKDRKLKRQIEQALRGELRK